MFKRIIAAIFLLAAVFAAGTQAQTVDELIKKNIEARGGMEKIKAVKSAKMTGKVHTNGVDIPITLQFKRPGMVYGEAEFNGLKIVKAYDGESAWQIDPFEGVKEPDKVTGDEAKEIIDLGDLDGPLVDYKTKGNTVELAGKEEFESTPVFKLKVTEKNGDIKLIYLDQATYLELKVTARRKEDGSDINEDTILSDYKMVGGVMIAHSVENRVNGEIDDQIIFAKVELNVPVDDSIFKMPKKAQEKK